MHSLQNPNSIYFKKLIRYKKYLGWDKKRGNTGLDLKQGLYVLGLVFLFFGGCLLFVTD